MISDMLTNEAMIETEVTNYTCPLFYLNYMVMRKAVSGAVTPGEYLFDIFADRTLIRADPAVVAQVAVELGMIGTKDGAEGLPYYAPCPMPLEETLRSQNVAGKCIRWKPEDQEFPAQLLEEVWERTQLTTRSQIEIINSGGNQSGKLRMISARGRRAAGCLIIQCGTNYDHLDQLDKPHCDGPHEQGGRFTNLPEGSASGPSFSAPNFDITNKYPDRNHEPPRCWGEE